MPLQCIKSTGFCLHPIPSSATLALTGITDHWVVMADAHFHAIHKISYWITIAMRASQLNSYPVRCFFCVPDCAFLTWRYSFINNLQKHVQQYGVEIGRGAYSCQSMQACGGWLLSTGQLVMRYLKSGNIQCSHNGLLEQRSFCPMTDGFPFARLRRILSCLHWWHCYHISYSW